MINNSTIVSDSAVHRDDVRSLILAPWSTESVADVFTGSYDSTAAFWRVNSTVNTWEPLNRLTHGHADKVLGSAMQLSSNRTPDFITTGADGSVILWAEGQR